MKKSNWLTGSIVTMTLVNMGTSSVSAFAEPLKYHKARADSFVHQNSRKRLLDSSIYMDKLSEYNRKKSDYENKIKDLELKKVNLEKSKKDYEKNERDL
ncbi:hypothetical protein [Vagococcus carniphilus]|uniref:hypothetical protein n=1 Tax=Vagococcus carniphilus TaxID=218144 RepID=UPI002890C8B0|nr:hypothetical protein [Vagococcus carniphilus]MDT2814630.1 hypothetical protein [Vagococcus carniphilus]MDT2864249.1 hypothetical protein [Vagococcus carniphilus]